MEPNTLSHLIDVVYHIAVTYIVFEALLSLLVISFFVWVFYRIMR